MQAQVDIPTVIYNGKTFVATAGTSVQIGVGVIKSVTVKALSSNLGLIYIGNSGVLSTNGFQLAAGDTISLDITNLGTVYINSDNNSEGITYLAIY